MTNVLLKKMILVESFLRFRIIQLQIEDVKLFANCTRLRPNFLMMTHSNGISNNER